MLSLAGSSVGSLGCSWVTVGFVSSSTGIRVVCLVPLIKSVSVLAAVAL